MNNFVNIINQFENKKILVVGDLILDSYLFGRVKGMSPEGIHPVIIVKKVENKRCYPGGACNVACNLASLGAKTYLCGVMGEDKSGNKLLEILKDKSVNTELIVSDSKRPTIEKERIIGVGTSGPEKIVRIDEEDSTLINEDIQNEVLNKLLKYPNEFDAVVVADYKKGFIFKKIIDVLPSLAKNGLTIVDTKRYDVSLFKKGFKFFTPNQYEAEKMIGLDYEGLDYFSRIKEVGERFSKILDYENVVMTCGAHGMIVYDKEGGFEHIKAIKPKKPYDVSGAGDTVIAALSLALGSGLNIYDSCTIASHAASIVVGKTGTATVSKKELLSSLANNS